MVMSGYATVNNSVKIEKCQDRTDMTVLHKLNELWTQIIVPEHND